MTERQCQHRRHQSCSRQEAVITVIKKGGKQTWVTKHLFSLEIFHYNSVFQLQV